MPSTKSGFSIPKSILAIPDAHLPFHNHRWLDWVIEHARVMQPQIAVQCGDLYDYYNLSRFSKSLDVMTPKEEAEQGRKWAEFMWASIQSVSPETICYQIKGNHDDRAEKRLMDRCPELASFVDLESPFRFDGVKTIHESYEELFLDDVVVQHGHKKQGAHARYNQAPTIVGHLHRGDVEFMSNRRGTFWELNAGFGGDINHPAFAYRYQRHLHSMTLGLGVVDEHGPRFMPFTG
jgi:hypothetical protein